jgi:hypothetical protein
VGEVRVKVWAVLRLQEKHVNALIPMVVENTYFPPSYVPLCVTVVCNLFQLVLCYTFLGYEGLSYVSIYDVSCISQFQIINW